MLRELRWLKYFLPRIGGVSYPIYLLYFVTSKCMGRCRHCFYWRSINQDEDPLTLEEISALSRKLGRLLQLTITGGEPLLRDDLAEIFKIFYRYNQPFNFGLATSGFFPDKLEKVMKEVLEGTRKSNFTVGLPVEGPQELNDYIRDLKGAFERTVASLKMLNGLKRSYPGLTTLVDITASGFNQEHLLETYQMIRDQMAPDLINLIILRGEPKEPEAKKIDPEKIRQVINLMENDVKAGKIPGYRFSAKVLHSKDIILRRIALDLFEGKKARLFCQAGRLIGVIYPEAEVYPCELWKEPIGNLRDFDYDLRKIWRSEKADRVRREIVETKCACYHQCFLSPSLFFDPWYFPKLLREMVSLIRQK